MGKHYHFVGIGGIGMSALAFLVMNKGCTVSGSDLRSNAVTERLKGKGADIAIGHAAANIQGADCVVYSSAVDHLNPELLQARKQGIPLLKRAQLLAELTEGYVSITVAGAHGKTTTSSMIAQLLTTARLHPTTAVGGIVQGADSHARLGKGKYFVTEVDESDGSFLCFSPQYSVITNIDFEHVDYYRNWEKVLQAYRDFIDRTADDGVIIACGDDKRLDNLLGLERRGVWTFGFSPFNDVQAEQIRFNQFQTEFDCIVNGRNLGKVRLHVPGKHNVLNALAAIALGLSLSIDFDTIVKSFLEYKGVQRRFQLKGKVGDVWVIDDYAHHPTEIRTVLETARAFKTAVSSEGRLVTIMQPHRYTRLKALMDDFAESLTNTDVLIVTDVYAASEKPIAGISAEALLQKIGALTKIPVHYLPKATLVDQLTGLLKPHDMVLTLGAGDITHLADDLVNALKKQNPAVEGAHL